MAAIKIPELELRISEAKEQLESLVTLQEAMDDAIENAASDISETRRNIMDEALSTISAKFEEAGMEIEFDIACEISTAIMEESEFF